jgi:hypothetical protein
MLVLLSDLQLSLPITSSCYFLSLGFKVSSAPSIYVLPLEHETKLHTHTKQVHYMKFEVLTVVKVQVKFF